MVALKLVDSHSSVPILSGKGPLCSLSILFFLIELIYERIKNHYLSDNNRPTGGPVAVMIRPMAIPKVQ